MSGGAFAAPWRNELLASYGRPMSRGGARGTGRSGSGWSVEIGYLESNLKRLFPGAVTTTAQLGRAMLAVARNGFGRPVPEKRIRRLASTFRGSELEDALATMRRTGAHVARVFDARGNTTGVLFLEDIIEELVGEVQDATSS